MTSKKALDAIAWAEEWLTSVATGGKAMSQRKLSSVERRGGGVDQVTRLAIAKGVHLLVIEDESGTELVAASARPFKVLC